MVRDDKVCNIRDKKKLSEITRRTLHGQVDEILKIKEPLKRGLVDIFHYNDSPCPRLILILGAPGTSRVIILLNHQQYKSQQKIIVASSAKKFVRSICAAWPMKAVDCILHHYKKLIVMQSTVFLHYPLIHNFSTKSVFWLHRYPLMIKLEQSGLYKSLFLE